MPLVLDATNSNFVIQLRLIPVARIHRILTMFLSHLYLSFSRNTVRDLDKSHKPASAPPALYRPISESKSRNSGAIICTILV